MYTQLLNNAQLIDMSKAVTVSKEGDNLCNICFNIAKNQCNICKKVFYCSRESQRKN
jgi:recombinational DNA repair protein RecR